MSSEIQNAIRKQAAYVKGKSEKLDAAAQLRKAADFLEQEAKAAPKVNFMKEIKDAKKSRMEKFAENVEASKIKELDNNMKVNGWNRFAIPGEETGTRSYSNRDFKGYRIVFQSDKFRIYYKNDLQVTGMHARDPHTFAFLNPARLIQKK